RRPPGHRHHLRPGARRLRQPPGADRGRQSADLASGRGDPRLPAGRRRVGPARRLPSRGVHLHRLRRVPRRGRGLTMPGAADTPATPTLRPADYLPYRLSVASNEVSRLIARAYEDRFGITIPQWRILANLGERGPLTPLEIGRCTVMDKVTVSRAAQGLV